MADKEWVRTKDRLVQTIVRLGFREDLGLAIAKNLGSPKAMERMISYLVNVKPKKEELVIDEMLAICSEIAAWREKKASEEANARYNEMLYYGLEEEELELDEEYEDEDPSVPNGIAVGITIG